MAFIEGVEDGPRRPRLISNPDAESIKKILELNLERATREHQEQEPSRSAQFEILNNLDQILG